MISESNNEIIRLLAEGKATKEVAEEVGMGYDAVIERLRVLRGKFGCRNTTQLVAKLLLMEYGLVSDS